MGSLFDLSIDEDYYKPTNAFNSNYIECKMYRK